MQRGGVRGGGGVAGPVLATTALGIGSVEANFTCVCGKSFSRRGPYERHLDVAHSNAACHKCRVCGKTFGSDNTLTMHMSVHGVDRQPFAASAVRSMSRQLVVTPPQPPPPVSAPVSVMATSISPSPLPAPQPPARTDVKIAVLAVSLKAKDDGGALLENDSDYSVSNATIAKAVVPKIEPTNVAQLNATTENIKQENADDVSTTDCLKNGSNPEIRKSVRLLGKVPAWKLQTNDVEDADELESSTAVQESTTLPLTGARKRKTRLEDNVLVDWSTESIENVGAEIEVTHLAMETRQQHSSPPPTLKKPKTAKKADSFLCPICGKEFCSDKYLSMHRALHEVVQPAENLMSDEYRQSETTEVMTSTSTKSMGNSVTTVITQTNGTSSGANGTTSSGSSVAGTSWTCRICQKTFAQNSNFKNHMRTHSDERPYVCAVCCIGFKERYHLKKHELFKHSNELREACSVCGKRFKDSTAVRAHERIHSDLRPYACRRCGKAFKTSECLWHHENRSKACGAAFDSAASSGTGPNSNGAGKKSIAKTPPLTSVKESNTRVQNVLPKISTGYQSNGLSTVQNEATAIIIKLDSENKRQGNCQLLQSARPPTPDKVDTNEQVIAQVATALEHEQLLIEKEQQHKQHLLQRENYQQQPHMQQHAQQHQTQHQQQQQQQQQQQIMSQLNQQQQQQKTLRYNCDRCSKQFAVANAYERHMTKHSEVRPYRCDSCDIGFKLKVHLKKHNLYRHSDDYPCECSICGKRFKDSSAVRLHERIHSAARPFACACGKTFKTRENLWGHQHRLQCDIGAGTVPGVAVYMETASDGLASCMSNSDLCSSTGRINQELVTLTTMKEIRCDKPLLAPRPLVPMQPQTVVGSAATPALAVKQANTLPSFSTFAPSVSPSSAAAEGESCPLSTGSLPLPPPALSPQPSSIARMCPTIHKFLLTQPEHVSTVRLPGIQQIFQNQQMQSMPATRPPPPYSERPNRNVLVLPNPAGAILPQPSISGTAEIYTSIRKQLAAKNGEYDNEDEIVDEDVYSDGGFGSLSPLEGCTKTLPLDTCENGLPVIFWNDDVERRVASVTWQKESDAIFHDISNNGFSHL